MVTQQVFNEQIRLLYARSKVPIATSVLVAALLCWSQQSVSSATLLLGWFGSMVVICGARMGLTVLFAKRDPTAERPDMSAWQWYFLFGAYVTATAWGAASVFLFPEHDPLHQIAFFVIMAGMAAGAVASLASHLPTVCGYLSLMLFPLALKMVLEGGEQQLIVGTLILLYWLVNVVNAIKIHIDIRENIRLHLESVRRERDLKTSEERYRHIFHHAPLGIFQYNDQSVVVDCNNAFLHILGTARNTITGFNIFNSVKDRRMVAAVSESLENGVGYFEGDYTSSTGNKTTPIRAFFKSIEAADGTVIGGVGIVEDFTEKKLSEQQIRYYSTYDALTELPNRRLLLHQLNNEISRSRRHGRFGALLFIDLDNFKTINDSLGHATGDELLKLVGRRLLDNIRSEDCASRMGGDEFIIIVSELNSNIERAADQARFVAEKLKKCLTAPCCIDGRELHVTSSIGVSLFPKENLGADDILKQADAAMYRAKGSGRNEVCFFLPEMQKSADQRLRLSTEIRKALEDHQLTLFYQPQVDRTGRITGAEALLRWNHPKNGLLAPGAFLPIIEDTGIMGQVDRWVLRTACEHIRAWMDSGLLVESQTISVNISGREFSSPDFITTVTEILEITGAAPTYLGIELTEGSIVATGTAIVDKIMKLREMGITFSVDDFGTGYSSLSYLKRLPLNALKIDRSFVRDIKEAESEVVLVDTIIMMSHNLGLKVIAEGVETEEELRYLSNRDCQFFQGYYFGKPSPIQSFTSMLESGISLPVL